MSTVFVFVSTTISTTIKVMPYIVRFLGLTESISSKLDKANSMHLHSAFINLENAKRTEDAAISNDYLKRAKDKFIDAISIETDNYNLITAYSRLAFCQGLLSDELNMKYYLKKAYELYRVQVSQITNKQQLFHRARRNSWDEFNSFGSRLLYSGVASYSFVTSEVKIGHLLKIMPLIKEIEKTGVVDIIKSDFLYEFYRKI